MHRVVYHDSQRRREHDRDRQSHGADRVAPDAERHQSWDQVGNQTDHADLEIAQRQHDQSRDQHDGDQRAGQHLADIAERDQVENVNDAGRRDHRYVRVELLP